MLWKFICLLLHFFKKVYCVKYKEKGDTLLTHFFDNNKYINIIYLYIYYVPKVTQKLHNTQKLHKKCRTKMFRYNQFILKMIGENYTKNHSKNHLK